MSQKNAIEKEAEMLGVEPRAYLVQMLNAGESQAAVARALGISRQRLQQHMMRYRVVEVKRYK